MKKILTILVLLSAVIFAKDVDVTYGVNFGVFGEMGIAKVKLSENGSNYTIDVHAYTTGIVKTMSGNRQEEHISKGHIVNGQYVSDSYESIVSYKNKESRKIYKIDHQDKSVVKQIVNKVDGKVVQMKIEELSFYSQDDLLTLYMNLPKRIHLANDKEEHYSFKAVGAENQNGTIDIVVPSNVSQIKTEMGDINGTTYIKAIVNQPIFTSKNGEIVIAVGKDGITQKAILANLLLFGNIEAVKK